MQKNLPYELTFSGSRIQSENQYKMSYIKRKQVNSKMEKENPVI
jgi:hypothetical protein